MKLMGIAVLMTSLCGVLHAQDGFNNSIFVRTDGADAPDCGTESSPCKSIHYAIQRASTESVWNVRIYSGTYSGLVTLSPGVHLIGYGPTKPVIQGSLITDHPAANYSLAMQGTDINVHTYVANLLIRSPDATLRTGAQFAGTSYGIRLVNCSDVFLENVEVVSGNGSAGSPGTAGQDAQQSRAKDGFDGEDAAGLTAFCNDSKRARGGAGSGTGNSAGGRGGDGGTIDKNCNDFDLDATAGLKGVAASSVKSGYGGPGSGGLPCAIGEPGQNGFDGQNGAGGTSSSVDYAFSDNLLAQPKGTSGAAGTDGGGGGGGGGSGGCDSGSPDQYGAGGGGGGSGGLASMQGGGPGMAGGSSIGIFLINSTIAISNGAIRTGSGGRGGDGGRIGRGQPGGQGGRGGAAFENAKAGGDGGNGGKGGNSGGGAGGNGGHSIGVLSTGTSSIRSAGLQIVLGSSGSGGSGGSFNPGFPGANGNTGERLSYNVPPAGGLQYKCTFASGTLAIPPVAYGEESTVEATLNAVTPDAYVEWDFGDGSEVFISDQHAMTHQYTAAGVYPVTLKIHQGACRSTITLDAVVNKKDLMVIADEKTRVYGSTNPELTFHYSGFLEGDDADDITPPSISTTATTESAAGTYPIMLSGGSAANYALVFTDGTLTVTKAILTAKAEDKARLYGAPNPEFTVTYEGFVNNDDESAVTAPDIATSATQASAAGEYAITLSGGSADNYELTLQDGTLTINKAPLTVRADDQTKIYGTLNPLFTLSYTGFVNGEDETAITPPSVTTGATTFSDAGVYPITPAGGAADNYSFIYESGWLTIVKADQVIDFPPIPSKNVTSEPFTLNATSSAGLAIEYTSSNPDVATISGNTVTITGPGETEITATQPGNANINAADPVVQTLNVVPSKSSQSISFAAIPDKTLGDPPFDLDATASSALPVFFTTPSSKIEINGSSVTMLEAGHITIVASQPGDDTFNPASEVSQSFCINPARPAIAASDHNTPAFTLASSSSTGNQWYRDGTAIAGANDQTYTPTAPGTYAVTVTVDQCVSEKSDGYDVVITALEGAESALLAFAVPVTHVLQVKLPGPPMSRKVILIRDLQGRVMEQTETSQSRLEINVSDYASGSYLLSVQQSGMVHHRRFIKQ